MDDTKYLQLIYSAAPSDFTATRNRLVKDLQGSDPEAAGRIKRLRKPTVALWAIDQLAVRDPDSVQALIATGKEIREATEDGDVSRIQGSNRARRDHVKRLTALAKEVLESADLGASPSTLERISNTLYVAAVETEAAEQLAAGVLDRELDASSLDMIVPFSVEEPATTAGRKGPDLSELKASVHKLERTAAQLELEADDREAEARRSRRAAGEARAAAEEAAARLEVAKGKG